MDAGRLDAAESGAVGVERAAADSGAGVDAGGSIGGVIASAGAGAAVNEMDVGEAAAGDGVAAATGDGVLLGARVGRAAFNESATAAPEFTGGVGVGVFTGTATAAGSGLAEASNGPRTTLSMFAAGTMKVAPDF